MTRISRAAEKKLQQHDAVMKQYAEDLARGNLILGYGLSEVYRAAWVHLLDYWERNVDIPDVYRYPDDRNGRDAIVQDVFGSGLLWPILCKNEGLDNEMKSGVIVLEQFCRSTLFSQSHLWFRTNSYGLAVCISLFLYAAWQLDIAVNASYGWSQVKRCTFADRRQNTRKSYSSIQPSTTREFIVLEPRTDCAFGTSTWSRGISLLCTTTR